jgi:multidrug efflux system outer membrane protein
VVALPCVLNACTIGPDFTKPTPDAPARFPYVLEQAKAESFADLGWAEVFHDAELSAVLATAVESNLDLKLASAKVEEVRGQLRVTRSALGPELRVAGGTQPNPASREDSTYSLGLDMRWEIDFFGRLRRGSEAARARLLATEEAARGVMTSLVANVATTWFRLRELDEEVAIIERTIASQQSSLDLVLTRKKNGIASGAEEQQARAQLAATRTQLPITEVRRAQAQHLLAFLLGDAPQPAVRSVSVARFAVPAEIPPGVPADLLARRPDLRQLEHELHAATANIGVAEATRFPYLSIGLTSFVGILSPELDRLVNNRSPAADVLSIGPFVDAPLFQSGRGVGNVEVAEAQLRQAEIAYRRGVLQAYRETADALVFTDKVRDFIRENEVRVDAAARLLSLQRKRYEAGVNDYLEVLDAERQLFAAEIDLARARLNQREAYVELYRALGGGWQP